LPRAANTLAPPLRLGWLTLPHSPPPVSDCQTPSGEIPGDEPEQGIDGYGGKDFEKRKVLRRQWKTP